jgi:hypothetical protein
LPFEGAVCPGTPLELCAISEKRRAPYDRQQGVLGRALGRQFEQVITGNVRKKVLSGAVRPSSAPTPKRLKPPMRFCSGLFVATQPPALIECLWAATLLFLDGAVRRGFRTRHARHVGPAAASKKSSAASQGERSPWLLRGSKNLERRRTRVFAAISPHFGGFQRVFPNAVFPVHMPTYPRPLPTVARLLGVPVQARATGQKDAERTARVPQKTAVLPPPFGVLSPPFRRPFGGLSEGSSVSHDRRLHNVASAAQSLATGWIRRSCPATGVVASRLWPSRRRSVGGTR